MGSSLIGLAVLLTGINVGWEKLDEGGYVYIIQIEPETLDALKTGLPIESHLEPQFRGIRSYRIIVGNGDVPREGIPDLPETSPAAAPSLVSPFPISVAGYASPLMPGGESNGETQAAADSPDAGNAEPAGTADETQKNSKPWAPLMIAMALLLGSVSGNLFLSWITWDTRGRYRRLLQRVNERPRNLPEYGETSEMEDDQSDRDMEVSR